MRTAPLLPPWTKALSFEIRLKMLTGLGKAFSDQGPGTGVCVAGGKWGQSGLMATGVTAQVVNSVAFARCSAWTYTGRVGEPS